MKWVRNFSDKVINTDATSTVYQRDDQSPAISLYPANISRKHLAKGFQATTENDTDLLKEAYETRGLSLKPMVCECPTMPGTYLAAVLDVEHDTLALCEYPISDVSVAARCSAQMAQEPGLDEHQMVFGLQEKAA